MLQNPLASYYPTLYTAFFQHHSNLNLFLTVPYFWAAVLLRPADCDLRYRSFVMSARSISWHLRLVHQVCFGLYLNVMHTRPLKIYILHWMTILNKNNTDIKSSYSYFTHYIYIYLKTLTITQLMKQTNKQKLSSENCLLDLQRPSVSPVGLGIQSRFLPLGCGWMTGFHKELSSIDMERSGRM